jgi:hypothetical protein
MERAYDSETIHLMIRQSGGLNQQHLHLFVPIQPDQTKVDIK